MDDGRGMRDERQKSKVRNRKSECLKPQAKRSSNLNPPEANAAKGDRQEKKRNQYGCGYLKDQKNLNIRYLF